MKGDDLYPIPAERDTEVMWQDLITVPIIRMQRMFTPILKAVLCLSPNIRGPILGEPFRLMAKHLILQAVFATADS
ncbi:MAG TPA: hypothetical protein VMC85_23640 [Desulfomonilaceae bacterium]|nr:hypothetical protein [Desulfomonilaceae bacterium]